MADHSEFRESRQFTADGAYRIVFDRPEQRNAFTPTLYGEIRRGVMLADGDPDVRCVVVEGSGGTFASGGDLKSLQRVLEDGRLAGYVAAFEDPLPYQAILDCTKPVIAKIDGLCLAGGLLIAASSDIAIATERSRFGMPEAKVGVADAFASSLLPAIVGLARARYLTLTGATITAAEAVDWGLILRAVPVDELEAAVAEVIEAIDLASPDSIAFYKSRLNDGHRSEARPAELFDLLRSPNAVEGLTAFVERRPPRWRPPS